MVENAKDDKKLVRPVIKLEKNKIRIFCGQHDRLLAESVGDMNKDGEVVIAPGKGVCSWDKTPFEWPEIAAKAFWPEEIA